MENSRLPKGPRAALLLLMFLVSSAARPQIFEALLNTDESYGNFVPNPGFEHTLREYCKWNQSGREYFKNVRAWDSPTESTADILSTRTKRTCWANPSKHSHGKQGPHGGDNMAGIKTYGKGGTDTFWHEYLMVKLDSALEPGQRYYAEMYVARAVASNLASNNIGMYFSDTAVVTRDRMPLFFTPEVNSAKPVKSRWNAWQKVSGVFEVGSRKNYLLIGNFYHDDLTKTVEFSEGRGGAYYYVDDVMVRRAKPEERLTPKPMPSVAPSPKIVLKKAELVSTKEIKLDSIDYRPGDRVTLENIFFDFDKAVLLPQSTRELDKLKDILTDYPHLHIEIEGHTDNVGSDTYNEKLSRDRAKAVVDYLIHADADPKRLSFQGYGSRRPIASNDSEQGRAKNRRVEFVILKN